MLESVIAAVSFVGDECSDGVDGRVHGRGVTVEGEGEVAEGLALDLLDAAEDELEAHAVLEEHREHVALAHVVAAEGELDEAPGVPGMEGGQRLAVGLVVDDASRRTGG